MALDKFVSDSVSKTKIRSVQRIRPRKIRPGWSSGAKSCKIRFEGEGGGGGETDASRGVEKEREAEGYALFELRRSRPVLHSVRRIFIVDLFHRKDVACLRRI